jgi:hypothetical protein
MLQAQVLFTLDRVPSLDDLDVLTGRVYPDFENLIKRSRCFPVLDQEQLLRILTFVCSPGTQKSGFGEHDGLVGCRLRAPDE